ncbi:MAG TPA: rhomboid family intramembrane serine protease [Ignavibacteriaceae bacterium]|nr:rhomboid family intramembrane serine protease [Ignavibacteriaceae bacterium]
MNQDKKHFIKSISISGGFLILLWLIKLTEIVFNLNIIQFALYPRTIHGLTGILISPLIHADLNHLTANSLPVFLLALGILYFYKNASLKVLLIIYVVPDIAVWLLGRSAFHIGASGLIYGYASFLFFSGLIRRDPRSIALALLVIFLYGSMIWGILPLDKKISWESHLYGALTGIACAFIFRKSDPYKKYEWEDEETELQGSGEKD